MFGFSYRFLQGVHDSLSGYITAVQNTPVGMALLLSRGRIQSLFLFGDQISDLIFQEIRCGLVRGYDFLGDIFFREAASGVEGVGDVIMDESSGSITQAIPPCA